jgi:DNA-binding transcriptional LysR family regulator
MDLNRVSIFVRVVNEGGFSAAARALGLPKSSVSRAVALLEEQLGVRLLQRSTRKVRLTGAGTAFYEGASRGISGLEEAAAAVSDMQSALRGLIRITAPGDAGVWLLEPLISRFVLEHPGVHVETVLTGRVVDLVEEGFDLAVRASRTLDPSLIARRLKSPEVGLFAAPAYLARRGTPARVTDLAEHDCVLFRAVRGRTEWTLIGPGGPETVEVSGSIGSDDFAYVRAALLSGVGIGLLPSFLCPRGADGEVLQRLLPAYLAPTPPLNLVYPSARYLPHRVGVFRDYLVAALGGDRASAAAAS